MPTEETSEDGKMHGIIDATLREDHAAEEGLSQSRDSGLSSEASSKELSENNDPDMGLKISIQNNEAFEINQGTLDPPIKGENGFVAQDSLGITVNEVIENKKRANDVMDSVSPLLQGQHCESSESSAR